MTAAQVLAILLRLMPTEDPAELHRYETLAAATAIVEQELVPRWRGPRHEFAPAIVTAMWFNAQYPRDVHEGSRLGSGGARCVMDIDPGNGVWKRHATRFEDLTGLELGRTVQCIRTGAETLVLSLNRCLKRHYVTNWREAMWSVYATGHKCWIHWEAKKRARKMRQIAGMFRP
jgi:hypothetical protein